jgi:hypothetical protein
MYSLYKNYNLKARNICKRTITKKTPDCHEYDEHWIVKFKFRFMMTALFENISMF